MKTFTNTRGRLEGLVLEYGKTPLYFHTISVLEGDGNYTTIYKTNGQSLLTSFTVKCFTECMHTLHYFFSPRKGLVINLNELFRVEQKENSLYAVMKDGKRHPLSRRRGKELLRYLKKASFKVQIDERIPINWGLSSVQK